MNDYCPLSFHLKLIRRNKNDPRNNTKPHEVVFVNLVFFRGSFFSGLETQNYNWSISAVIQPGGGGDRL